MNAIYLMGGNHLHSDPNPLGTGGVRPSMQENRHGDRNLNIYQIHFDMTKPRQWQKSDIADDLTIKNWKPDTLTQ